MKRSPNRITYHPATGVNLDPGTPVIFIPGPNAHGLDPNAEYIGVYQEYVVLELATHLRILRQGKRFSPVLSNVYRIWDARDAQIEYLTAQLAVWEGGAAEPSRSLNGGWMPSYARKEQG